jgi:IPT/TIG domain
MSLGKRHIGRRVAGIGVGVSLMMLGLAAPAYAAVPGIASFSPASGPAAGGCVVVVTGTALDDFAAATWTFDSTTPATTAIDTANAPDYVLISDTTAWVTAPVLSAGGSYTLKVANLGGTSPVSTTTFLATAGAGDCAPTITSFTPACGSTNDKITFTGTNLLRDPTPLAGGNDIVGGTVNFFNTAGTYATVATVVPPDSDTETTLIRFVPSDVADGPVQVTAGAGSLFTTDKFLTPPPDCVEPGGTEHARNITFKIKKSGAAKGVVSSTEDPAFTDCAAAVPVKIQRKTSSGWKTVGKTTTDDNGAYAKKVKNKKGKQKFRALAPKVSLGDPVTDLCLKAKSATRTA